MTTDILFAKQSFMRGIGSIGNLSGEISFNSSVNDNEADVKALLSDWQEVGRDIEGGAINEYAENA
ncbi:MAG: hypothetical protein Q4A79_03370 [Candidatus Saccharibacteria bacterium]|nr:hypothetical protein [Candidatus Saccharibacteria bacterium]